MLSYPIILPSETRIVIIAGYMKSGTTWLMNSLNSHPDICCKGEMHLIDQFSHWQPDDAVTPSLETLINQTPAFQANFKNWINLDWSSWNHPENKTAEEKTKRGEEALQDMMRFMFEWNIQRYISTRGEKIPKVVADKTPQVEGDAGKLLVEIFAPYKPLVIHLIRDPRDVAVSRWYHFKWMLKNKARWYNDSWFKHRWFKDSEGEFHDPESFLNEDSVLDTQHPFTKYPWMLKRTLEGWLETNKSIEYHCQKALPGNYIQARYEDMKTEYRSVLSQILDHLKLDSSDSYLSAMESQIAKMSKNFNTSMFRKGVVGGWQKYFSQKDLQLYEELIADQAGKFGYS